MASASDNIEELDRGLTEQMKEFLSFIRVDAAGLTQERLRGLLENLEEELDSDDICVEETISKLNFKSWVYIKMENREKAEQTNDYVISITNWTNIMSIRISVSLKWRAGKETDALNCLMKLYSMKARPEFNDCLELAKAEMAYFYCRIGGPRNMWKAINLLEAFVHQYPQEFYWKLRLGSAYGRSTHLNIYTGMPKGRTFLECVEKSVAVLTDVVKNSADNRLCGPAFSELAVLCNYATHHFSKEDHGKIFNNKTPADFCDEALKYGETSPWVMTNCGKVLQNSRAIDILQRCLDVRKHTTTYHQLGICYMQKAKRIEKNQIESAGSSSDKQNVRAMKKTSKSTNPTSPGAEQVSTPMRRRNFEYPHAPLLKLSNKYFGKARSAYLNAIGKSHNRNVPAIYSLGLLYKLAGLDTEALESFNKVTNNGSDDNLVTVIKAYEQAGLCYLKMKDGETRAEDKLMKAISLAVKVENSCPHSRDWSTKMWVAFRTMEKRLESENPSLARDKKEIRLLELVSNHREVVKVVEKILTYSDSELKDPEIVKSGLNGYMKLNEPEKALTFLNMVSTPPDITHSDSCHSVEMMSLRSKVFLTAAKNRLQFQNTEAIFVFQELFKLHYGQHTGYLYDTANDNLEIKDVLLFYDDAHDTEEGLSQTSKTVQVLQSIFSQVFGLDTSKNLQDCLEYGPKFSVQLEEMKRYRVVIVILGEEDRDREFEGLLKIVPSMETTDPKTQAVLVIDACRYTANVPAFLRQYDNFRLQERLGDIGQMLQGADCGRYQNPVDEVIMRVFGEDLDTLMKLFCFVIKQKWPCN